MSNQGVSSSSPCWKYDVFLSFRGADTRRNFTDHLYAALKGAGIYVFRDDNELERGKEISALLKAIEESRFSIIVFSRNYASSTWCLDELVKIVECKNSKNQTVIPIFYDVDPSTVRNQSGTFREAFVEHEKVGESIEKVEKWKTALKEVSNISGWHLKERYESELVKEIAQEISGTLSISKYSSMKGLIGLDSRLKKLKMLIDTRPNEVRMVGICGMGGIGKTTIARAIFELISSKFEGRSFVDNVRENSENNRMVCLQEQILSQILIGINIKIYNAYDGISMIKDRLKSRKVLIVLDDVDHEEQLNKLAENCDWFGSGSRIIITTRDRHLLKVHRVHEIYEVEKLNGDEGYRLLSLKAFQEDQPSRDHLDLLRHFVQYASGLPLALKVLGSHLFGRTRDEWKSALNRLEREPHSDIFDILKISFDGLTETEKCIFLDIACFFKGKEEVYVKRILDGCDFNYDIGVAILIDKCLITRNDKSNILWMHDLLQEMGHQIVIKKSPKEPGNRSRLWKKEDIKHVLTENTGTKAVEGIMCEKGLNLSVSAKAFSNMTSLRLLKIINVQLQEGLEYLSNELRLLIWHGYSLKSLPSSFQPDKIVELELHCSLIEQLWKRSTHSNMLMLTSITLQDCNHLKEIPNLTWAPNLVDLYLEDCPRLLGIHSPLLVHKKLKSLAVYCCSSLMTLPGKIHMESLEDFKIVGCPKLKKFPEIAGRMENLRSLSFTGTAVREMPSSIELLVGLRRLNLSRNKSLVAFQSASIELLIGLRRLDLSENKSLVTLPSAIGVLKDLELLYLDYCDNLIRLPSAINNLKSLVRLDLTDCFNLESLPSTINGLQSLHALHLSNCTKLENVPETLGEVAALRMLDLSRTAITEPVSSIFLMRNLELLRFRGCKGPPSKSSYLPLFSSLMQRRSPTALKLPASSDLCYLKELDLRDCNLGEGAISSEFFAGLSSLEKLSLGGNHFSSLPTTVRDLPKLIFLDFSDCKNLQSVPELPSGTKALYLDGCDSFKTLTNAVKSFNSEHSKISCINCLKLIGEEDFKLSVVKAVLKERDPIYGCGQVVYPGGDIPKWVAHQSKGSSISIERPSDFYNNKLVGFILCFVFVVNNPGILWPVTWLACQVKTDVDKFPRKVYDFDFNKGARKLKSEHIWLCYQTKSSEHEIYNHINLSFDVRLEEGIRRVEVKRCGIHPIYEQDLINFNPSPDQPTVDVTTTSGNLPQDDDEEPQTKRFKLSASRWQNLSLSKYVKVSKHKDGKFYGCQDT